MESGSAAWDREPTELETKTSLGVRGGEADRERWRRGRRVSVMTREEVRLVERTVVKFERRVEGLEVPGGRPKIPAFRTRVSRCP